MNYMSKVASSILLMMILIIYLRCKPEESQWSLEFIFTKTLVSSATVSTSSFLSLLVKLTQCWARSLKHSLEQNCFTSQLFLGALDWTECPYISRQEILLLLLPLLFIYFCALALCCASLLNISQVSTPGPQPGCSPLKLCRLCTFSDWKVSRPRGSKASTQPL